MFEKFNIAQIQRAGIKFMWSLLFRRVILAGEEHPQLMNLFFLVCSKVEFASPKNLLFL